MGLYSQLDAVNQLLAAVGETPMAALDLEDETTQVLLNQLEKTSREVQTLGWSFNYEEGVSFAPDTDGYINLPNTLLQVSSPFNSLMLVQRGNRLYSKKLHSFKISASVIINVTYLLSWEDLPSHAQNAILSKSCAEYSLNNIGSEFQLKALQTLASQSWADFNNVENKNDPILFLDPSHNPSAAAMLYRGRRSGVFPSANSNILYRG